MTTIEGKGIFIYGDEPSKSVPVIWRLTDGRRLSDTEPWRAEIICKKLPHDTLDVDIFDAHNEDFIFKLKTDDDSVFVCGIYEIDHLLDAYPTLYFEICSREQRMGKFSTVYPSNT
jgi:hypothetical protein